jgi:hypothetical protein
LFVVKGVSFLTDAPKKIKKLKIKKEKKRNKEIKNKPK